MTTTIPFSGFCLIPSVKPPETRLYEGFQPFIERKHPMAKYTDVDLLQPNVELDADIKALVTKEPETLVKNLQALGIDGFAMIKRGVWFAQHIKTHPEYGEAVDAKVNQILGPSILTVENVFTPNVEIDAKMVACMVEGKDSFRKTVIEAGFTDPNLGEARAKWIAAYFMVHPEYEEAVKVRTRELLGDEGYTKLVNRANSEQEPSTETLAGIAEAIAKEAGLKATSTEAGTKIDLFSDDAQWEALKGLGLDPTPETLEFINQLADSAIAGTPLAQPYIAVGAVVLNKSALGQGVDVTSVSFHQTKLAEMVKHPQQFAN